MYYVKSEVTVDYLMMVHRFAIESTRTDELWLSDLVRSDADLYFTCEKISATADMYERSAIGLYNIACNHPFVEGNKRTALMLCENLLDDDLFINTEEKEIFEFVREVACGKYEIDEIMRWLRKNTGRLLPE